MQQECYQAYATNYKALNKYKIALEYQLKYDELKDSIFSDKLQNKLLEFETQYKNEQNEREIEILQKEKELNELNLKRRRLERNTIMGGFVLVILLILILYRSYRIKKGSNRLFEEKNNKLEILTTEQKELIAMKNKLISIIGHDLKNPFNSIMGLSDLLYKEDKNLNKSDKKEMAKNIHSASHDTFKLLENLLQWAKSQSDTTDYSPVLLSLNDLIKESFSHIKSNAKNKKIELENNIENELQVFADKNMLLTIMRNLISNAIKFSHEGGSVRIEAIKSNTNIIVKIIDSGIGIHADQIPNLFIVGKSHSTHGTANEKGSGLGLLICNEFIVKHGGSIQVDSVVGKGSVFSVSIPLH